VIANKIETAWLLFFFFFFFLFFFFFEDLFFFLTNLVRFYFAFEKKIPLVKFGSVCYFSSPSVSRMEMTHAC